MASPIRPPDSPAPGPASRGSSGYLRMQRPQGPPGPGAASVGLLWNSGLMPARSESSRFTRLRSRLAVGSKPATPVWATALYLNPPGAHPDQASPARPTSSAGCAAASCLPPCHFSTSVPQLPLPGSSITLYIQSPERLRWTNVASARFPALLQPPFTGRLTGAACRR